MIDIFEDFNKTKEFLVCVDSDGCAMDAMNIKHKMCFGPQAIKQWSLEQYQKEFQDIWDRINLYSKTRGINRFKGLSVFFDEIKQRGIFIEDADSLKKWVTTAKELSNPALEKELSQSNSICLKKALAWSKDVNAAINLLPEEENKPFDGVKEGLGIISKLADIVVVSSANRGAIENEWQRCNIKQYISLMLGQEAGTKQICISKLLEKGYSPKNVLMVGDAMGDLQAAQNNKVWFYPILVNKEATSWNNLASEAIQLLTTNKFNTSYQQQKIDEFNKNLDQ